MAVLQNQYNPDQQQNQNVTGGSSIVQPQNQLAGMSGASQGVSNKPASSGNFTNVQQVLNANKGAGQQIGGAIQTGINQENQQNKDKVDTQAGSVAAGVQAANTNTTNTGNYTQQITQPTQQQNANPADTMRNFASSMGAITNDQSKLQQFTNLRTGNIAQQDYTNMQNAMANYNNTLGMAQNQLAGRVDQLTNAQPGGRTGLLGEFVGTKAGYGTGARNLDNLFLNRDASGTLNNVYNNLLANKNEYATTYGNKTNTLNQNITDANKAELDAASALNARANKNTEDYLSALGSQQNLNLINTARANDQQKWKDALDILQGKKQGSIGDNVWHQLGLQNGLRSMNVIKNASINDLANLSNQVASNYNQVATDNDVSNYANLAKLAGIDISKLNADTVKANKLQDAVTVNSGQNSLLNRLLDTYNNALDKAQGDTLSEKTGYSWRTGNDLFGYDTHYEEATASQNMGELLKNTGLSKLTPEQISSLQSGNVSTNNANVNLGGNNVSSGTNIGAALGGNAINYSLANTLAKMTGTSLNDFLSTLAVGNSGSSRGDALGNAQKQANAALMNDITNYINNQGFNDIITKNGVVSAADFAKTKQALGG